MRPPALAVLGTAFALVVAAFAPWVTLGFLRVGGMADGAGDGWLLIIAAVLAAFGARRTRAGRGAWLVIAGGAIGLAVAIWKISDIDSVAFEFAGRSFQPEVGWGLWLAVVAGALTVGLGIKLLSEQRADQAAAG